MSCAQRIEIETLLAWWLNELPQAAEESLEEHVFACAHCTRRIEELAALAAGTRAAVRAGAVGMVVSPHFVATLKQAGLRVREYRLAPGESVNCTLHADDDAVVTHIRAPLAGVSRLDAVQRLEIGGAKAPKVRIEDIPFDPATGEVLFVPPAAALRHMPDHTLRVELVAVAPAGETTLGEYTFAHSAS